MHIAFLTPEYPDLHKPEGGLGNYVRKVSLELIRRGNAVTVFILAQKGHDEIDQGIQLHFIERMKFHWRFHRVKALHPWLELEEQRINARRLRNAVLARNKADRIDILQTPNYKTPGLYLCRNKFFPVVCRCSSYQPFFRSANGTQRTLPGAVADLLEARQVIEADGAFSPSEFIAEAYERLEAVKPFLIRTPIDLVSVDQDPSIYLKIAGGKKYLLFFGALNGLKGVDLLIRAIPGVLSAHKDLNFILIGRNDPLPGGVKALDVLQSSLKDYVQEHRVIYLPSLPKAQLYPFIQNALGVILPSRVDNYPNSCLEAYSLGIPVIGTYRSSLDEMIEDGITGFLAENGNTLSLEHTINRLLELTPRERVEMVQSIQLKVDEIQKEDRTGILLQFYKKVTAGFSENR